ncbi:hypothetical protein EYV94_15325 [Puteibacter caeruleilacunae]|nr:hypothetical protein EYV94_15325 [Puteibacter caeruleilacunae]
MKKYDGKLPGSISEQKLNKYIKEVAEINESIVWARTEGNRRKQFVNNKFDLITTYTDRRSFATNLYLRGKDPRTIMDITGHSTLQQFMDYVKITREQSARKLSNSGFFKR